VNIREVLRNGWMCPKCLQEYCSTYLPHLHYTQDFVGSVSNFIEVECGRCGYFEIMKTADYEEEKT
jgi:ribosomal protein S27AE